MKVNPNKLVGEVGRPHDYFNPSPSDVRGRRAIDEVLVGVTAALMLLVLLVSLLCGGCQGHTVHGLYSLPMQKHETDFLEKLAAMPNGTGAAAIRAYMEGRPKVDIAGASADGFETVSCGLTVSVDPKTGAMKGTFSRASDPNVRAIEAAGAVASDITSKAVSAAVSSQTFGLLGGASAPVGEAGAMNPNLPLLLEFLRSRATTSNPTPSGPAPTPSPAGPAPPAAGPPTAVPNVLPKIP